MLVFNGLNALYKRNGNIPPPSSVCLLLPNFPCLPRAPLLTPYLVNATMARLEARKGKKGKIFNNTEERILYCNFLQVSQDPISGNEQHNMAFWDHITRHYNETKPHANPACPARLLETKWEHIKHDVSKFCRLYKAVYDCRESNTSVDNVLE